jgi:putative hydrolase of the HAD superfamily
MGRRFAGLILDFAGVLTSNMVEVIDLFEARERVPPGRFLRVWADPKGQELYRRLELGEISQRDWNEGFGALAGISPDNLMGRVLQDLMPAYDVLKVARVARAAGVRTAVLSNSLGREPHDPYAAYDLIGLAGCRGEHDRRP